MISYQGKMALLWVALMLCYLLGDVLRILDLGQRAAQIDGQPMTQMQFLMAAGMMAIPILMVVLSVLLPLPYVQWMGVVAAALQGLTSGQRVLVHGASGAVGVMAVQVARAAEAKVDAVCGSSNLALVSSLGADKVADHREQPLMQLTASYDIVFDAAGKAEKREWVKLLRPGGRYGTVAGMESAREERRDLDQLVQLMEQGKLRPIISKQFAFHDIAEAHRYVDTGHKVGSAVVTGMHPERA